MKKFIKLAIIGVAACAALSACSKPEPPKTEPEPVQKVEPVEPMPVFEEPNADSLAALERARLEAERLERERMRLEELMSRIMSEDIYFDFDKYDLTDKAKELLAEVAELLIKENNFFITIEGHTDARGTEDYNMMLGAKRAMKVKEFLMAYGVPGNRIDSVSYGKERPKVVGETEEIYAKNRRANFRVQINK